MSPVAILFMLALAVLPTASVQASEAHLQRFDALYVQQQKERRQMWEYHQQAHTSYAERQQDCGMLDQNQTAQRDSLLLEGFRREAQQRPGLAAREADFRADLDRLEASQEKERQALRDRLVTQRVDARDAERAIERLSKRHYDELRGLWLRYMGS